MIEPTVISVAEEAVERQRATNAAALREFVTQWDTETMPACPIGMALLYDLLVAHPAAYEMARQRNFEETPRLSINKRCPFDLTRSFTRPRFLLEVLTQYVRRHVDRRDLRKLGCNRNGCHFRCSSLRDSFHRYFRLVFTYPAGPKFRRCVGWLGSARWVRQREMAKFAVCAEPHLSLPYRVTTPVTEPANGSAQNASPRRASWSLYLDVIITEFASPMRSSPPASPMAALRVACGD